MTRSHPSKGRYIRAGFGAVAILGGLAALILKSNSVAEAVLAGFAIACGFLMVDPKLGGEIRDTIRAWRGGPS